jgi:hypothetical protein
LQETLEWLANPDNLNTDVLPPGLANWDPSPYLASAFPVAISIIGVNFMHELGHRIAAAVRGVKLGPTYFIPNLQIGSFGGITPLQSLLKDRNQLWDVAAAGPIAGVSASIALLVIGLSQSHPGGLPQVSCSCCSQACRMWQGVTAAVPRRAQLAAWRLHLLHCFACCARCLCLFACT